MVECSLRRLPDYRECIFPAKRGSEIPMRDPADFLVDIASQPAFIGFIRAVRTVIIPPHAIHHRIFGALLRAQME